ncbi:MAG: D-hexose-6-phosphate mutarotase, partial [Chloroflexi bacterium]
LRLTADGFPGAVIWNPGPEKAAALADLDSYQHMLCIEAAVIGQPVRLGPGSMWQGTQTIEAL